jgi:hypothetical protein
MKSSGEALVFAEWYYETHFAQPLELGLACNQIDTCRMFLRLLNPGKQNMLLEVPPKAESPKGGSSYGSFNINKINFSKNINFKFFIIK